MKRHLIFFIFAFAVCMQALSASAMERGLVKEQFSAKTYYIDANDNEEFTGNQYWANQKMRMDGFSDDKQGAGIARFDKRVVWTLIPEEKSYLEMSIDHASELDPMDVLGKDYKATKIGKERLQGFRCTKHLISYSDPSSRSSRSALGWFSDRLGVYIKIQQDDGSIVELRDIKVGPQPDYLFEFPNGYKRILMKKASSMPDSSSGQESGYSGMLLFPNSDFEQGNLSGWISTGMAFRHQPTLGDNPTARGKGQPSGHQGEYWIGTYEKYNGPPNKPGWVQGNFPKGTLASQPFTITHEKIGFLVGGGRLPGREYVALVVDGAEVRRATGANMETMSRETWDVREFAGKKARIIIVDKYSRGWGHINADDFTFQGKMLVEEENYEDESN